MVKKSEQDRPKYAFWEARNFDIGNLYTPGENLYMKPETRIPTDFLEDVQYFPFFPKEWFLRFPCSFLGLYISSPLDGMNLHLLRLLAANFANF